MSCWRVLQLSNQPKSEHIPQILIKPRFDADSYAVFLTDLSNIWGEELDLAGIVDRASEEESPIEVSKQDTSQLTILLDNVRNSLVNKDDTYCCMTQDSADGVILHTTISLPQPLDSLRWKFRLRKRTAVTLRNELILPLLVSSHIQHDRLSSMISTVADKDRAITRLIDQYESSNLDLAAAFPSIGSLKSGRRVIKREQAARHVPGLQAFDPDSWRRDTAELHDADVSTLGLFREALSECTPKVPSRLLLEEANDDWWASIDTTVKMPKPSSKPTPGKPKLPSKPVAIDSETEGEETEDEFEVHENFKSRPIVKRDVPTAKESSVPASKPPEAGDGGTADEEDEDDLDAPPRSQSQARTRRKTPPRAASPAAEASPPQKERSRTPQIAPSSPPAKSPPKEKPKAKGFRIGGKTKKFESPAPTAVEAQDDVMEEGGDTAAIASQAKAASETPAESKTVRKGFKIGGKGKATVESKETEPTALSPRKSRNTSAAAKSPPAESSAPVPTRVKEMTPVEVPREETAEGKAERKRVELKRKNEEAAKKQAQSKKKKRF